MQSYKFVDRLQCRTRQSLVQIRIIAVISKDNVVLGLSFASVHSVSTTWQLFANIVIWISIPILKALCEGYIFFLWVTFVWRMACEKKKYLIFFAVCGKLIRHFINWSFIITHMKVSPKPSIIYHKYVFFLFLSVSVTHNIFTQL